MCHFHGNFEPTQYSTSASMPTTAPAHVCRVCGCQMDALHRPEATQTNSAGQTRVIPASTVITCKNPDCQLNWQTFEAKTYASEDLTRYGVNVKAGVK